MTPSSARDPGTSLDCAITDRPPRKSSGFLRRRVALPTVAIDLAEPPVGPGDRNRGWYDTRITTAVLDPAAGVLGERDAHTLMSNLRGGLRSDPSEWKRLGRDRIESTERTVIDGLTVRSPVVRVLDIDGSRQDASPYSMDA
jgi:hypothetical protein